MKSDVPVSVRCFKCNALLQIPPGGKRLCACGAWVAAEQPPEAAQAEPISAAELGKWPKIEGDLSAIERLNDGYRRIKKELNKAIVGQERVIEELLIAIFGADIAYWLASPAWRRL